MAAWPVRYFTMLHMTNDSEHFLDRAALEKLGAYPVAGNYWRKGKEEFVPLYVGRMIHQFDHRAASVMVNEANLHNPAVSREVTLEQKADPSFQPRPQFWVPRSVTNWPPGLGWLIGFRDIARATDARTMIASIVPLAGFGNKLPLLRPSEGESESYRQNATMWLANMNVIIFDFITRQKLHSTSMNWFIVEQLPVIPISAYERAFGPRTAAEIIRENVLTLTYTAHDMAPFAKDLGYVDQKGEVKPPFAWDEKDRVHRRAKLDALFFHLYGITDHADVSYVFSSFPIVEREDMERWGRFLSRDLTLAYMNALAAGDPDARVLL